MSDANGRKICPVCEQPFERSAQTRGYQRYCSEECAKVGAKNLQIEREWGHRPGDPSRKQRLINDERSRLRKLEVKAFLAQQAEDRRKAKQNSPTDS